MLTISLMVEALTGVSQKVLLSSEESIDSVATNADASQKERGSRRGKKHRGTRAQVDPIITGGIADSRQAYSGALFVALPGEHVDGHDFLKDAFERGARVALVQKDVSGGYAVLDLRHVQIQPQALPDLKAEFIPGEVIRSFIGLDWGKPVCIRVNDCLQALQTVAGFWRNQLQLRVVGITGSVGKSTTKELVSDVLGQRYLTLKSPGNLNNEIGLPLTLLSLTQAHQRAVLEMGFYVPGEIALLCQLARPHVGVVTNISMVHAERAGTQEEIARGKAELVESLPEAPLGVAVLNYDDKNVRAMAGKTKARVMFYGDTPDADIWADEVEGLGLDGIRLRLHYRKEAIHLHVPLIGRHSVSTILRAAAVGIVEELNWQEIVNGLRSGRSQLRLLTVRSASGALVLDDTYNAEPISTLAALNLLNEMEGRKIAVLGDMLELGIYEDQGHEMVGLRAAEVVDELITIGERGKLIAHAAWKGGLSKKVVASYSDVDQAIIYLQRTLSAKDVVLVKGSRSMHMERIVAALEAGQ